MDIRGYIKNHCASARRSYIQQVRVKNKYYKYNKYGEIFQTLFCNKRNATMYKNTSGLTRLHARPWYNGL